MDFSITYYDCIKLSSSGAGLDTPPCWSSRKKSVVGKSHHMNLTVWIELKSIWGLNINVRNCGIKSLQFWIWPKLLYYSCTLYGNPYKSIHYLSDIYFTFALDHKMLLMLIIQKSDDWLMINVACQRNW